MGVGVQGGRAVGPEEMEQNCRLPEQEGAFQMSWVSVFRPRSMTH